MWKKKFQINVAVLFFLIQILKIYYWNIRMILTSMKIIQKDWDRQLDRFTSLAVNTDASQRKQEDLPMELMC